MNKENICSMVRDLLPLYMEGLTSEETGGAVEHHLENCEECRKEYRILAAVEKEKNTSQNPPQIKEIDYLKKIKKYQNVSLILGAVVSFFLGASMPLALIVLSIVIKGKIPDYYLARLQIAWHIGLLKMFIWGAAVCACYLAVMFLIRKWMYHKK